MSRQPAPAASASRPPGSGGDPSGDTAVPTLRVMRLQSPELHTPTAGCLDSQPLLNNALCLPDSLGVFVGETFTAYLGVLNVSLHSTIRRLNVTAQLQTPSQRRQLTSALEGSGVDVPPAASVDAIVSHAIEEAGQHILRVEVGYMTSDGNKTFRKFYRFQVVNPLSISELTVRGGDSCCYVSLSVEYNPTEQASSPTAAAAASPASQQAAALANSGGGLVISDVDFLPASGLSAQRIGCVSPFKNDDNDSAPSSTSTATQLLDTCGYLKPGSVMRYLFEVKATSKEALLRGIAAGDLLGKAIFTWRKSMGETGRIASSNINCPAVSIPKSFTSSSSDASSFVVHRSGLSVDVAAAAASRGGQLLSSNVGMNVTPLLGGRLLEQNHPHYPYHQLPVTVEPIDPPSTMQLNVPTEVQFLVVNHSEQEMTLQLQFRLAEMATATATSVDDGGGDDDDGENHVAIAGGGLLAVCGPSFVSLGQVSAAGGSAVVPISFLPLAAGLLTAKGCWIVDLASDWEIPQPGLFHVHVLDKDSSVKQ